jgi:hypothetical protein
MVIKKDIGLMIHTIVNGKIEKDAFGNDALPASFYYDVEDFLNKIFLKSIDVDFLAKELSNKFGKEIIVGVGETWEF